LRRARQSPPGARREGGARGHRDRGARRLVPPADRAPRRAPRVPPRRSPPGRAIALLLGSALAVLVAAFVKGAIGFGFPTLGTPLVAPSWGRWLSGPVGRVAGVVGGVTNVPSLPLILYFYALGMEKDEFVRSIAVTFLAYKLVQLVSLVTVGLLDGRLFGASLALTAVAVGAFALGLRVQDRLDARAFNRAVLVFLSAIGVWLVVRALGLRVC